LTNAVKEAFRIGDDIAEKLGFFLVDAEYVKEKDGNYLRLYVDKEGGIGIDDCERFSNEFGAEFDKTDLIGEPYCLEVSSPGVDRTLKTEREFTYFSGREVSVKLYKAVDGKKEFDCILKGINGKTVTVEYNGEELSFGQSEAVYVKLAFKF